MPDDRGKRRAPKPARQTDAYRHLADKFAEARGWSPLMVYGIWEQLSRDVESHAPHLTRPHAEAVAWRLVKQSLDKQGATPD